MKTFQSFFKEHPSFILRLFFLFIPILINLNSYAQNSLYEYLNSRHIYVRNNDGSISDSNISYNENYLRWYISEAKFNSEGKEFAINDSEELFDLWLSQLLANELPEDKNADSRFETFYKNDNSFKELVDLYNSLPMNPGKRGTEIIKRIIQRFNNLDDIEKQIELWIKLLDFMKDNSPEPEGLSDTLMTNVVRCFIPIDNYVTEIANSMSGSDWIYYIPMQVNPETGESIDEDEIPLKYIRCCKRFGDYFLKEGARSSAILYFYQAYIIAYFIQSEKEMGLIEQKLAEVYTSHGSPSFSKYANWHMFVADSLLTNSGYSKYGDYSQIYEAMRIKSLNLYNSESSFTDKIGIDYLVSSFKEAINMKLLNSEKFYLYQAIGLYFGQTGFPGDKEIAKMYLQTSLLFAMNDRTHYEYDEVSKALNMLSWINSAIGDKANCLKYNDWGFQLARKHQYAYRNASHWFLGAKHLMNLGEISKAKEYLDNGFEFANSKDILRGSLAELGYSEARRYYYRLYEETKDSKHKEMADSCLILLNINKLASLEELTKLVELDNNMKEYFSELNSRVKMIQKEMEFEYKIYEYEGIIGDKKIELEIKEKELNEKTRDIYNLNERLRLKADSLGLMNDSLIQLKRADSTARAELRVSLLKQEYAETREKQAWKAFIGALALMLIVLAMTLWFSRRVIKLREEKKDLEKKKISSDTHSAISRVLSRCLSHNIGSHALSKFIDKDKVIVADTDIQYKSGFVLSGTEQELLTQPALIASFNEYLKHRMDLLADIATTTSPVMESPMYLVRDIMSGLDKNRILLNRISGVSPRINFSFKVVFNREEIRNLRHQNDPVLSMTNDLLGAQAFYIILENIIRNIYKHGNPANDFQVVIDVNQCISDNSYYEINVFDTLPKSMTEVEEIVLKRNESFNEPVFYNNKLRDHNLGSIEMAVCSCYLRCLPVDSFTNESFKINVGSPSNEPSNCLIHAYVHKLEGEKNHSLGYRFFISKPRQVLVVSNNDFQLAGKSDILLKDIGISVIRPDDLNSDFISKHQFIFLDKGIEESVADSFPSQLPKRIVKYSSSLQFDTIESFTASLWQQYLMNNFSKYNSVSFRYYSENPKLFFSSEIEAENNFSVYIDNHDSKWICRDCKTINKNCFNCTSMNTAECEPLASFNYYEMALGHSRLTKSILRGLIFSGKSQQELIRQNILQSEYAENVLTRIMIIDERIQHNLVNEAKMYRGKVPLYDYFHQQCVCMPKKEEANLNFETFGTLIEPESESSKIRNYIRERIDSATFCVIHLGILEKMLKSGSSKSREAIDELISGIVHDPKQRRKLIITSNRGGALNIPNDISYVPFPLLQNALETMNDKFVLTSILFNARKCI
ncbi:MAG: hypothetical protein AB2L17_02700 [Lentimicrobium sp.]